MNECMQFQRSLAGVPESKIDNSYWSTVTQLYNDGKYKESIIANLNYLNKDLVEKYGNSDKTVFKIPHGSIIVTTKITDTTFEVTAPFLKAPEQNAVPLLRQVCQLSYHPLTLSTIKLTNDNELTFQYQCPIELAEPYKLYYLWREICHQADNNDDKFIDFFGAKHLQEPEVKEYDETTKEKMWQAFQAYTNEALNYIEYFEKKQWTSFIYDIAAITYVRIAYYAAPQGTLRSELEAGLEHLYNRDIAFAQRLQAAKELLNKFKSYDKDRFMKNLYKTHEFLSYRYTYTVEDVRKSLESSYTTCKDEMQKKDYIGATYTMQHFLIRLFFYYHLPIEILNIIEDAMEASSGKPWEEAATILREAYDRIMYKEVFQQASLN